MLKKLTMLFVILLVFVSLGQNVLGKSEFYEGKKYQALAEKGLSYLLYNPQGESADGKAVYIVGGALCPYTQKVMRATDKQKELIEKGIQIRWVFPLDSQFTPDPVIYLATEPIPQAFEDFFQRIAKEKTDEQDIIGKANMIVSATSGALHGYPSISYKTSQGVKYASSLDDVLADADKIVPVEDNTERTREFVREFLAKDLGQPVEVKNNSKKVIPSYSLPDKESPKMGGGDRFSLKPGQTCVDSCYDFNGEFYLCKFDDQGTVLNYFYEKN